MFVGFLFCVCWGEGEDSEMLAGVRGRELVFHYFNDFTSILIYENY